MKEDIKPKPRHIGTKFTHEVANIACDIIGQLPPTDYNEDVAAEITIRAAIQAGIPATALLKAMTDLGPTDYHPITNAEIEAARRAATPVDLLTPTQGPPKP